MKKAYIVPTAKSVNLAFEGLVATSGGLNDGDSVGNQRATDDDDDNFFSNRRNSIWDNTEW